MKNRIVKQILEENGFVHVRSRGDHSYYEHKKLHRPIVLYGDDGQELKKWHEKQILASIKKSKKRKKNES